MLQDVPGDSCDDVDAFDGDGCSAVCAVEEDEPSGCLCDSNGGNDWPTVVLLLLTFALILRRRRACVIR